MSAIYYQEADMKVFFNSKRTSVGCKGLRGLCDETQFNPKRYNASVREYERRFMV
jgi:hypothetical protein